MQEGVEATSELVVACGETAKLLEAIEESFDKVSCLVSLPVVLARPASVAAGRNDRLSTCGVKGLNKGIAVVPLIGDDRFGCDGLHQRGSLRDVGDMTAREDQPQRMAQGIDTGVDLGGQPAARPADRLIATVFLGAPAECW